MAFLVDEWVTPDFGNNSNNLELKLGGGLLNLPSLWPTLVSRLACLSLSIYSQDVTRSIFAGQGKISIFTFFTSKKEIRRFPEFGPELDPVSITGEVYWGQWSHIRPIVLSGRWLWLPSASTPYELLGGYKHRTKLWLPSTSTPYELLGEHKHRTKLWLPSTSTPYELLGEYKHMTKLWLPSASTPYELLGEYKHSTNCQNTLWR